MEVLPLIVIPVIYFVVALIKPHLKLRWNMCAICVAVSTTWVLLLVLWLLGMNVSTLTIGILMGMSVSGLMYKAEPLYKKRGIKHFWFVRLLIVVGGFYSVLFLLKRQMDILALVAITTILAVIVVTFLLQGVTHQDVLEEGVKAGKKGSLLKKLDDCC